MTVVTFNQARRHERPGVAEQLEASRDQLDIAEKIGLAGIAITAAGRDAFNASGKDELSETFRRAKIAVGELLVAIGEFEART